MQLASQAAGTFATFTADSRTLTQINAAGSVAIGGDSAGVPQTGAGSLAVFTFTATAAGTPSFRLIGYNSASQPLGTTLVDQALTFRVPDFSNSPATLTVNNTAATAPAITTQPAAATVTAGQTATFSVVASGTAPLTYQWQKNNVAITGATGASYTTPATTTTDNGANFRVVVTNGTGSATSNAALLTVNAVQVSGESITLVVSPGSCAVGDTVTVTVTTQSATAFVFWQAQLLFDQTKVALTAQAAGSFATFTADSRTLTAINAAGSVAIGGDSSGVVCSGNGTLASFTFRALAAGTPSFTLGAYDGTSRPLGTALVNQALSFRVPTFVNSPAALSVNEAVGGTQTTSTATATPSLFANTQADSSPCGGNALAFVFLSLGVAFTMRRYQALK